VERVIEIENLTYRYARAEETSLKNITLAVEKGKFMVIMGHAGAGKTSLSLCLNGLIPQFMQGRMQGKVRVKGKDTRSIPVQELAKEVGLVLQDPESQIICRTVGEDVAFGPRNFGIAKEEIQERVRHALAKVGLLGYEERITTELSGGEKQRLVIAGVLAIEPEILVMDEPTSELDPEGRLEIYQTLDELCREKERTIVVIEHSSEEILARADEVIVLKEGEIAWQGQPAKLFRNIPLVRELGLKPLPVSLLGWSLYERGWITQEDIPLEVVNAEKLIRRLIGQGEKIEATGNKADEGKIQNRKIEIGLKSGEWEVQPQRTEKNLKAEDNQRIEVYSGTQAHPRAKEKSQGSPPLIRVKDLYHQFASGKMGVGGIDLEIGQGEFVALVGANGAGKTTLAKHMNGLLKPTSGDVIVKGRNTKEYDTAQLAQIVGYVFQNPDHQIFSATVEKELEFGLKNAGFTGKEVGKRIAQALELTGLEKYRHVHPFTLSKGERQFIAVASVLALTPEILVIDEPTTGLDWTGVEKIMELLQQLHREGTTILMISHDMDNVLEYAERVILMQEGRIILDAPPWEAFTQKTAFEQGAIRPPQLAVLQQRLRDLNFQANSVSEFRQSLLQIIEEGKRQR